MSLGNFGVYKRIFAGVSDYTGFNVEFDDKLYEVANVEINNQKGVVLTLGEELVEHDNGKLITKSKQDAIMKEEERNIYER